MASASGDVVRLKVYTYIHVHDNNENVTRVEKGPRTFQKKDHEQVLTPVMSMIVIPPDSFVVIENPIERDAQNRKVFVKGQQVKLVQGDRKVIHYVPGIEPFALYPGEVAGNVQPYPVLQINTALRVRALEDFSYTYEGVKYSRIAGEEYLYQGPCVYNARKEEQMEEIVRAYTIGATQALRVRARDSFFDSQGKERIAGEEWLVTTPGAYMLSVHEDYVELVDGVVLTPQRAIHVKAINACADSKRRAGEEWLVTDATTQLFIPGPNERVTQQIRVTVLDSRQYAIIRDPVGKDGKQHLGTKEVRRGPLSFFLHPGESFEAGGIQSVHVLESSSALLLEASQLVKDGTGEHKPGERWMVRGPCEYVPTPDVRIIEKRQAIPLDKTEGIYVRCRTTGQVRAEIGNTYMLKADEEPFQKILDPVVEQLVTGGKDRKDKSRVVTFQVPHNSLCRVYDYQKKSSRIVSGPQIVMLGPDESFTLLRLSGGKPKIEGQIKTLHLYLGPDFMTDILSVETSDHARLTLNVSYNWEFTVRRIAEQQHRAPTPEELNRAFNVSDHVGDCCTAIASRIRGAVSGLTFDQFHKTSSKTIRCAVFGVDAQGEPKTNYTFDANGLVITNVDILSAEPEDQKTLEALTASVQQAIAITTKLTEAKAQNEAESREQAARATLQQAVLQSETAAEEVRLQKLTAEAENLKIEQTGLKRAEAEAEAAAAELEGAASIKIAESNAEAAKVMATAKLTLEKLRQNAELDFQEKSNELDIAKSKALAQIETAKFKKTIAAIGPNTIAAMARAGPELQAKLLGGLGLQGYLVTDGTNPINLFNTAQGLTGGKA